jgi:hypothetical protein
VEVCSTLCMVENIHALEHTSIEVYNSPLLSEISNILSKSYEPYVFHRIYVCFTSFVKPVMCLGLPCTIITLQQNTD